MMWIILSAFGLFLFSIACFLVAAFYCIRSWVKTILRRYLAKNKVFELKLEKEDHVESPNGSIVSHIIEENKKRWLEKQAEADARLNERDNRPYAKVLQFPRNCKHSKL